MANYLNVPASSGANTPNQAGLASGTTTIDVRIELAAVSWASGAYQTPIAYNGPSGSDRWEFDLQPSDALEWEFSNSAGGGVVGVSTVGMGFAAGSSHGIRVLHTVAAGTVDFYTSPDFSTWTALGTQNTGLATTGLKTAGPSPSIWIGNNISGGSQPCLGKFTKAQVIINGVTIFNMDWTTATLGTGPWTSGTGETWTQVGTASVVAEPARPGRMNPRRVGPSSAGFGGNV